MKSQDRPFPTSQGRQFMYTDMKKSLQEHITVVKNISKVIKIRYL